jgi:hypothetical protein
MEADLEESVPAFSHRTNPIPSTGGSAGAHPPITAPGTAAGNVQSQAVQRYHKLDVVTAMGQFCDTYAVYNDSCDGCALYKTGCSGVDQLWFSMYRQNDRKFGEDAFKDPKVLSALEFSEYLQRWQRIVE